MAAAIGFGTSISGVAGGLAAVTSGPEAVPASAQTSAQTSPSKLNLALVAQANRQIGSNGSASVRGVGGGGGGSTGTTGTGAAGGTGGGSEGSGSGSGSGSRPVVDTSTSPPQINLPRTGGATDG
ncbi:MAG: hypothetical protein WB462_11715, partial [Solirubrobacterales bacterium]